MPTVRLDLSELEDELGSEADAILRDVAIELVNELKKESPMGATGDLQRSWQIFRTQPGEVWLGSRIHYALDVQEGTPPHTPDFEAIQAWARRKLGDEGAAPFVHQKIQEEGTDANPYMDRAFDNALAKF